MMTKRDEIKKVKKSNIHDSAIKLFSNKGYFQTSISDISIKAKMVIRIITQNRNLKILNVKYDFVFRED